MCTVTWSVSPDIQSDGEHAVSSLHCTVLAITILPTVMLNGYLRNVTITQCIQTSFHYHSYNSYPSFIYSHSIDPYKVTETVKRQYNKSYTYT